MRPLAPRCHSGAPSRPRSQPPDPRTCPLQRRRRNHHRRRSHPHRRRPLNFKSSFKSSSVCVTPMYLVRRQTITMCRSTRHKSERCRDERCFRDERGRRDERAGIRERSRSRERGHRYRHARSKERYHPSRYDDGRLLQGGAHRSAERYRDRRLSAGRYHATPPTPPPPLPPPPPPLRCRHGTGAMPRMSASRGGSTSAGSLRPSAAALTPRLLTARLSKASTLPELLSLQQF